AARHKSATDSGVALLPFLMGTVISVIAAGQVVGLFGYYWPFCVASPVFLAIGSGLLYTLSPSTSSATLVGFQILCGLGVGLGFQNSLLAIQVEFNDAPALLSQASSMATFGQFLGGTIGLGIAEPVFASELSRNLLKYAPNAPAQIVKESPVAIWTDISTDLIPGVVLAYCESLKVVFVVGVPIGEPFPPAILGDADGCNFVAFLGLITALFIKNVKIEKTKIKTPRANDKAPNNAKPESIRDGGKHADKEVAEEVEKA
ncbi:hypothetical protein HWV62_28624, partial [Athelia sp. TMB]